ncbi:MAG: hydrogenase-1 expression HyaE [Filomicrobium sp.]
MFSPLLQSIIERHGYDVISHDDLAAYSSERQHLVLFFAGDAERLAESNDVAVVLPELEKAFKGTFTPVVVARDSERELQRKYRFNAFPSLVFLRHGEYLGTIPRIQDWADYIRDIQNILSSETSAPPAFKFPEGCAVSAAPSPSAN